MEDDISPLQGRTNRGLVAHVADLEAEEAMPIFEDDLVCCRGERLVGNPHSVLLRLVAGEDDHG
jgi:hypothetical protein